MSCVFLKLPAVVRGAVPFAELRRRHNEMLHWRQRVVRC